MKYNKFFELAKEAGIEEVELFISTSYALSCSLFHGEIDKYSVEEASSYIARGIVNGKIGSVASDSYSPELAKFFVDEIIANAKIIETNDPAIMFKGSEKYKKVSTFNKQLANVPVDTKIAKLFELEKKIKEADERIVEIEGVEYAESASSITLINSHGLKLSQKSNDFQYVAAAVAKQGEQVKTGYDYYFGNDFSKV
jgi:PmbA protein